MTQDAASMPAVPAVNEATETSTEVTITGDQVEVATQQGVTVIQTNAYYLQGFLFVMLLAALTGALQFVYSLAHGLNYASLWTDPQQNWNFVFLGGHATPPSIGTEIFVWAFTGVACRMAYVALKAVIAGQFNFMKYLIIWTGTCLFAWGIGVAVIFLLKIVRLTIAGIEITLENISIETIIAISFLLGFYHEEALSLLARLRDQVVVRVEESKKPQV